MRAGDIHTSIRLISGVTEVGVTAVRQLIVSPLKIDDLFSHRPLKSDDLFSYRFVTTAILSAFQHRLSSVLCKFSLRN